LLVYYCVVLYPHLQMAFVCDSLYYVPLQPEQIGARTYPIAQGKYCSAFSKCIYYCAFRNDVQMCTENCYRAIPFLTDACSNFLNCVQLCDFDQECTIKCFVKPGNQYCFD